MDESRGALALELFGRFLKSDDGEAVTDVVPADVVQAAQGLLEGTTRIRALHTICIMGILSI